MNSNWFSIFLAVTISCTADPQPLQTEIRPVDKSFYFQDKMLQTARILEKDSIDFKSSGKLLHALYLYEERYGTIEYVKLDTQLQQANGWNKAKILKKNRKFVRIAKEVNLDLVKLNYIKSL
jgi:hypothetical protein